MRRRERVAGQSGLDKERGKPARRASIVASFELPGAARACPNPSLRPAPKTVPTLPPIDGVRIATAEVGIRYKDRTDVLYVTLARDTAVAGVFTRSKCPSAQQYVNVEGTP